MTKSELKFLLKKDREEWNANTFSEKIFYILTNHNKYVKKKIFYVYRKYNYYKEHNNYIMSIIYGRRKNKITYKYNVELCSKDIGYNVKLMHRNVIINENAKIGNNVVFHGFNIVGNNGKDDKSPTIGNNVDIRSWSNYYWRCVYCR